MSVSKNFLGRGWSFPPEFDKSSRCAKMVSDEEDIQQSLYLLLSTRPGERITNPNYGCNLHNLMFERIDGNTRFLMKDAIKRAILFFEPRITLEEIIIDVTKQLDGLINITIHYTIRKINIRSNIVYPFYKLEGTIVDESNF